MNKPDFALLLVSSQFYMFLITIVLITAYLAIKYAIKQKRIKKAYFFLTEKYEVISYDKDGIPLFMKKGENIEKI